MDRESVQGEHMMISNSTLGSVGLTFFQRKGRINIY